MIFLKKIISDEKRNRWIKNLALLALILVCLVMIWFLFKNQISLIKEAIMAIVVPAVAALFISYLFEPLLALFTDKLRIRKPIAVALTVVIIVLGIGAAVTALIIFIYNQVTIFVNEQWPQLSESFKTTLSEKWPSGYNIIMNIIEDSSSEETISSLDLEKVWDFATKVFSGAGTFLIDVLLTIVFTVYFLYDKGKVFKGLIKIFPNKVRKHLVIIGPRSNEIIRSYFKGKIIAMAFLAVILSIGFFAIGLGGYGILFAIILACMDIIPIVGPFIGTAIPVLYALVFRDSLKFGIWTFVLVIIIDLVSQAIQEKVISPKIIGKQMKINSLLLLCSMLFFNKVLGVAGIILAIPICGIIKVVAEYIYEIYVDEHPEFLDEESKDNDLPIEEIDGNKENA